MIELQGKLVGGFYRNVNGSSFCEIFILSHEDESFMVATLFHELGHVEFMDLFGRRPTDTWWPEECEQFEVDTEAYAMYFALRQSLELECWRAAANAMLVVLQTVFTPGLHSTAASLTIDTNLWHRTLRAVREASRANLV